MSSHIGRSLFGIIWRSTVQNFSIAERSTTRSSVVQLPGLLGRNRSPCRETISQRLLKLHSTRASKPVPLQSTSPSSCRLAATTPLGLGAREILRSLNGGRQFHAVAFYSWKRKLHSSGQKLGDPDKKVRYGSPRDSPIRDEHSEQHVRPAHAAPGSSSGHSSSPHHKYLIDRFPHMRSPTREELLGAATGFWSRFKIRFKWFSIRSVRPFNIDEIGAFFSWVLLGHVLWIFLGTTTFFSLIIFAINTVFAQGERGFSAE